jgi:hypothetical protein
VRFNLLFNILVSLIDNLKKNIMKRILTILIFMGFFVTCFAQTTQTVERLKVIDAGGAKLVGGEAVIQLENELSVNDYTVVLTPMGDYKELFIAAKKERSFIVKSKTSTDAEFQYIVILKKSKEIMKIDDLKQK